MQTITVRINNPKVLKLLEDIEALNLIEIVTKSESKDKTTKLSERLAGSITPQQADLMRSELKRLRNE